MPEISVTANGPYVATGLPLTRQRIVKNDDGEAVAWDTTATLDAADRVTLCRCGQSSNKPFCDSTHAKVGFAADDVAATAPYAERSKVLGNQQVTIRDDRAICVHAAFCTNAVTNVWKMAKAGVDDAAITELIDRCPSGALSYDTEPLLPAAVAAVADGPLWVTGGVAVTLPDGTTLEPRNRMTLCRCGHSSTKPLCDGSHTEAGFTDA